MMMKKNIYIVIAVIVGVVIGAIGMKFFLSNENRQLGENGKNASKVMRVLYWQAPMDPTYIKDKPGKSPMGMELIPVYEGTETSTEAGVISIDPTVVQNIGVKTTTVKKIKLEKTIKTIGRIDYDEKRVATVHSKVDGWVEKLYVDYTGMNVKKNDILLELYSPALISAQEEYLMALKSKDDITTVDMDSLRELSRKKLELWDVPAHQIKELEEGGKVLRTLHIHSPATGVVTEKPVTEGMYIRPGTRLYTIADISSVWVYADIYEHEISLVKVGQNAEITLTAYPGEVFIGEVSFIYPFMEAKTRTNKVRLVFKNTELKLKPDMYSNITIKTVIGKNITVVPTEAVIRSGERNIVIVTVGEGKFMAKEIVLGAEAEGYYEIKEGVNEGEVIVTSAQFLIDSESKLKEAISKMLSESPEENMDHDDMEHDGMTHEDMNHEDMSHDEMVHDDMGHEEEVSDEMNHESMGHDL